MPNVQACVPATGPIAGLQAHHQRVHDAQQGANRDVVARDVWSRVVLLRDLQRAVRPLPWWTGPNGGDAVAFARRRFHEVRRRQRVVRRAYHRVVVDGTVVGHDTTVEPGGFVPRRTLVSWQAFQRSLQRQRRHRDGGNVPVNVGRFRRDRFGPQAVDGFTAGYYGPAAGAAKVPITTWPWTTDAANRPGNDTLATYYRFHVLQPIEYANVASYLGTLVHQHLLVLWSVMDDPDDLEFNDFDNDVVANVNVDVKDHFRTVDPDGDAVLVRNQGATVRFPSGRVDALDNNVHEKVRIPNDYVVRKSRAFQPVFETRHADAPYQADDPVLVPQRLLRHLDEATTEYKTRDGKRLVHTLALRLAAAVRAEQLTVVAVEPWVYDPYRLVYRAEPRDAAFFWTRADFVAVNNVTGGLVVGEIKNRFGATTQRHVLADAADVQQACLNAFFLSLAYRVRIAEVCLLYANRSGYVAVVRFPFARAAVGDTPLHPFVRTTLAAALEVPALYVDERGVESQLQHLALAVQRQHVVPVRFLDGAMDAFPDIDPQTPPIPVGNAVHDLAWYSCQYGFQPVHVVHRGPQRVAVHFGAAWPPPWNEAEGGLVHTVPPHPPGRLFFMGAAAAVPRPFTYHGGVDPFHPVLGRRVYPATEPAFQRRLRTTWLVQHVARAAGRMAHLVACTHAPLRLAWTVLGRQCGDDADADADADVHDVGTNPNACARCARWARQYRVQGVPACPDTPGRGPCAAHADHVPWWRSRQAVLIRALHRHLNRHVQTTYNLDAAGAYQTFIGRSQRPFWAEPTKRTAHDALADAVRTILVQLETDATVTLRGAWTRRLRRAGRRRDDDVRWVMGE